MAKKTDFNPDELTQKTDKHEQEIAKLFDWAATMQSNFGSNESIANTFLECSRNAVKYREMFSEVLVAQLKTDDNLRTTLSDFIDQSDRKALARYAKQVGFVVWTIIIALISGGAVFFLRG